MHVLICGGAGSGKTFLAKYFKRMGVKAYDADSVKGLARWVDRRGRPTVFDKSDKEWWVNNWWEWDKKRIKHLLGKGEEVFLFGNANNNQDIIKLFDRAYYLKAGKELVSKRLRSWSRENPKGFGKSNEERDMILSWIPKDTRKATAQGFTLLDASLPPRGIFDAITGSWPSAWKYDLLEKRFREHMLKAVGKKPTKVEIASINKRIRKDFDRIYSKPDVRQSVIKEAYDKRLSRIWGRRIAGEASFSEVRLLLKRVHIGNDANIASLASGLAVFELFLAKEVVPQGTLSCIDISDGMNRRARRLVGLLKCSNARIITAPATKTPIKSGSQDIVLVRFTGLTNDKRWKTVLSEAHRIMRDKPDSRLVCASDADFTKTKGEMGADLRGAGMKLIAMERFRKGNGKSAYMFVARPG
jgi:ubiquinone/menaquinone biosynthesis C-methylase UbiE